MNLCHFVESDASRDISRPPDDVLNYVKVINPSTHNHVRSPLVSDPESTDDEDERNSTGSPPVPRPRTSVLHYH